MGERRGNATNRSWLLIGLAVCMVLFVSIASLAVGAASIPLANIGAWISHSTEGVTATERTILWELRLPRILLAVITGVSLATAGVGFQGLFRNVLADPYVIGASSGAALGVSIAVVTGLQVTYFGLGATSLMAMAGSIGIVMLVFALGAISRQTSTITLLLAGVAISSMTNALVSLLMFLNDQKAIVILSWLMGSLAGSDWQTVLVASLSSCLGVGILWSRSRQLDAFLLGDAASQSLGLDPLRFRCWVITGASVATASAVSSAGIIGFVGLIAPQIARLMVGPRHALLLPMSACAGAITMLVADAVARTIVAPTELPIGIVTALLGCPFFVALLLSRSMRGSVAT